MDIISILNDIKKISFKKRPNSIPMNYRPMYRMSEIALILYFCGRSNTLSILKLQYISWLVKDGKSLSQNRKDMNIGSLFNFIHIDPTLNLSIDYAIGSKVIILTSTGKLKLTDLGIRLVNEIVANDIMYEYCQSLKVLGKSIKVEAK